MPILKVSWRDIRAVDSSILVAGLLLGLLKGQPIGDKLLTIA
ncbi:MAG: hypothetical protein V2B13_03475 [Pseudomonadota bacterium]